MLKKLLLLGLCFYTFSVTGTDYIAKLKNPLTIEERIRNAINEADYRTIVNLVTHHTREDSLKLYCAIAKDRIGKKTTRSNLWFIKSSVKFSIASSLVYSVYDHFKTKMGGNWKCLVTHLSSVHNLLIDTSILSSCFLAYLLIKDDFYTKHNEQLLIYLYLKNLLKAD